MVRFSDLNKNQREPGKRPPQTAEGTGLGPGKEQAAAETAIGVEAPADFGAIYEDASVYVNKVFDAVKEKKRFALDPGFRIARQIVESRSPGDALFVRTIQIDDWRNYLINKSINVSIYAVRLAHQLGYARERQVEIGMAGLLHEVGMCRIPDSIVGKKEQLSRQEFEIIQQHSEFGYQVLEAYSDSDPYLAEAALQIHERIDGSGYPQGLKGDEIHDYAQIVGLVDIYEALTHSRPQRNRFNHFSAIKEIIKSCKTKFQKKHLKALLNAFSIFPLSTYVRLNSNAVGRVIETYPEQPMRPRLQITFDSQGRKVLTERIVNLPDNALLYIVDSVSDDEIEQLERGHPFQSAPGPPEKRDFSPPPPSEPRRKDPPEISEKPASSSSAARDARSGKRPLLGLLMVLLFAGGISAWQGRLPVAPSSAENGVPARMPQKQIPTAGETPRAHRVTEAETDALAANPAVPFRGEIDPGTAVSFSAAGPGYRDASAPGESVPEIAVAALEQELQGARPGSAKRVDQTLPVPAAAGLGNAEAPQRPEALPEADSAHSGRRPYSLLLSSFRSEALTRRAVSIYRGQGISPYCVKVDLGDEGVWYRLFYGQYGTFAEADAAARALAVDGAVVKKTRYANRVAADVRGKEAGALLADLTDRGFSPYTVGKGGGRVDLFVGAFYTRKGAEDHRAELLSQGVQTRVVER